jgi:hypothetical protein
MKLILLLIVAYSTCLISCTKKQDEPATPILNFFKSVTTGDSAGVINSFNSTLRQEYLAKKDSTSYLKQILVNWKGAHADISIKEVKIDSMFPDMAKVYVRAIYTGKEVPGIDSAYFMVNKEENEWRLSSLIPHRDKHCFYCKRY